MTTSQQSETKIPQKIKVDKKSVLMLIFLGVLLYFLLPQLGELNKVIDTLKSVKIGWLIAAIVGSLVTYIMATISLAGATNTQLQFWPAFLANIATSFTNKLMPSGFGGYALTGLYLHKLGVSRKLAFTSVTLKALAAVVPHIALIALLSLFFEGFNFWNQKISGIGIIVGCVIAAIVAGLLLMIIPSLRKKIVEAVVEPISHTRDLFLKPIKFLQLFGGSLGITVAYSITLLFSLYAFNIEIDATSVFILYLTTSVISVFVPSPEGLGALEAGLIGGLSALGVASNEAIAAVLVFRLVTFWLPIIPGLIAFNYLQRKNYI